MPSVLEPPLELEDPTGLAADEFVMQSPGPSGGSGIGVSIAIDGKVPDQNIFNQLKLIMAHVALRQCLVDGEWWQVDVTERFAPVGRIGYQ